MGIWKNENVTVCPVRFGGVWRVGLERPTTDALKIRMPIYSQFFRFCGKHLFMSFISSNMKIYNFVALHEWIIILLT